MVFHEHIVEDDATTHTDLILQSHTVLKYGRGQAPEPGEETFIAPSSPAPIHRNPEISIANIPDRSQGVNRHVTLTVVDRSVHVNRRMAGANVRNIEINNFSVDS